MYIYILYRRLPSPVKILWILWLYHLASLATQIVSSSLVYLFDARLGVHRALGGL